MTFGSQLLVNAETGKVEFAQNQKRKAGPLNDDENKSLWHCYTICKMCTRLPPDLLQPLDGDLSG
jgi:hypothetical protein